MVDSFALNAQSLSYDDVQPIFESRCVSCHSEKQIGPIPLTTFEEVQAYAQMIRYVIDIDYMPPFLISDSHHALNNDRRLSLKEKNKIISWIDSGINEGEKNVVSKPKNISLMKADMAFEMQDSFEQYGVYYDQYRSFIIPTNNKRDTFISAIQFAPGNHDIVRGASISVVTDTSNIARWDKWDPNYGYFSFGDIGDVPFESRWYNWSPGQVATMYPSDEYKFLPKDAFLVFHIHYGPTSYRQRDKSQLLIKYGDKSSRRRVVQPLVHAGNYSKEIDLFHADEVVNVHASFTLDTDIKLYGLMPHGHFLCREWSIFIKDDQNNAEPLIDINDWDFKWRQMFSFEEPLTIKKGSAIHVLAKFDNTNKNLLNPSDPPASVTWGKRMFEEMMMVYLDYTSIDSKSSDFRLAVNPTLVHRPIQTYSFFLSESRNIRLSIKNCEKINETIDLPLKKYSKGWNSFDLELTELPFGNYHLQFFDDDGVLLDHQIIAYLNERYFGLFN